MGLSVQHVVDAPLERVWTHLARLDDHVTWMRDAKEITFVGEQRHGVGTVFTCVTQVGPLRTRDVMTVTDWREGVEIGVAHRGAVRGLGAFTLRALSPETTEITWREALIFPWWFAGGVGEYLSRPLFRWLWRSNLRAFAARVAGELVRDTFDE